MRRPKHFNKKVRTPQSYLHFGGFQCMGYFRHPGAPKPVYVRSDVSLNPEWHLLKPETSKAYVPES